jgi:hypothetical protein
MRAWWFLALALSFARPALALEGTVWIPDGVAKLRGALVFTSVGLGPEWGQNAEFRELARRLEAAVVQLSDEDAFGAYLERCASGGFQPVLQKLADLGTASGHPELANVPLVGCGHSHGGDFWNYFNACYPHRMALVFDKSSGGVQYGGLALATPMIWEVGSGDVRNSKGNFRAEMFSHRALGSPLTLVIGPGEDHNTLGAGAQKMVIDLIEAIFRLRVPADADATSGVPALRRLDEAGGGYWLGDNYSRDVGAYPTFPGREALPRTSFLPNEALARQWQATVAPLPADVAVASGFCATCYPQPPGEPDAPDAGAVSAPEKGCSCVLGGRASPSLLVFLLFFFTAGLRRRGRR